MIFNKGFLIFKNFFEFLSGDVEALLPKSQAVLKQERKFVMNEIDFDNYPLPVSGYAIIEDDDQPLEPPLQSS